MAVGIIGSPATWYNGLVAPPTWFQNIQDTLNNSYKAAVLGTISSVGMVIDGTGNAGVTPVAGGIKVSAVATGTTAPTPTLTQNVLYKEYTPWAMVKFNVAGTVLSLSRGANISSINRAGVGLYDFTLVTGNSGGTASYFGFATPNSATAPTAQLYLTMTSSTVLRIFSVTVAGAAVEFAGDCSAILYAV